MQSKGWDKKRFYFSSPPRAGGLFTWSGFVGFLVTPSSTPFGELIGFIFLGGEVTF